jgi:hypothetical protein
MLELDMDTYDACATQTLACIKTSQGAIIVNWIPRQKEIICSYGGRYYRGQNEEIGSTIAALMNCNRELLIPSDLQVSEGTSGKFEQGTEKQLSDLLQCEWSDYACDYMEFRCYMYNTHIKNTTSST